MVCSETGFAEGLVWMREVKFGLTLWLKRFGVREECNESLGYVCLSISAAALLPEHEVIRLAISDTFSGDMIRDTLHSEASARCRHHVYICLSAFATREASISEYSSMGVVFVKSATLQPTRSHLNSSRCSLRHQSGQH